MQLSSLITYSDLRYSRSKASQQASCRLRLAARVKSLNKNSLCTSHAAALSSARTKVPQRTKRVSVGGEGRLAVRAQATETMTPTEQCSLTTSVTATSTDSAIAEAIEAADKGADIIELRLDFIEDLSPEDLVRLLEACPKPAIVTYRPDWEGGQYKGDESLRQSTLRAAVELNAAYVDIELKAAVEFFANGGKVEDSTTKIIVSSHNYSETPSLEELQSLATSAREVGADIVKIATTAQDITDVARVAAMVQGCAGPAIGLAMGEAGQMTRILAPKFGSFLTFGALEAGKESAPGQPTLNMLRNLYRLGAQTAATPVYGVIGNPIGHSKSPVLHNNAFQHAGVEGVYLPLLVHSLPEFLSAFSTADYRGFSVTIPHKEAALAACDEVDPVAASIGAVNTLIRTPEGKLKGYNTDWEAAIGAIEDGLGGGKEVLKGKTVLVIGAGGAGKGVAFGAKHRGANVIIANRTFARAEALAAAVGCTAVPMEDVAEGKVPADVLANTTSIGMQPNHHETPVPAAAVKSGGYSLVFDAVYTPMVTTLLKAAEEAGAVPVSGLEMFVGQAAAQFELFTGKPAPVDLMRQTVLDNMK